MISIHHNPLSMVVEVANELWPDLNATVFWVSKINEEAETDAGPAGVTYYSEDECKPNEIAIRADLPIDGATEVLAHEIAHVVAGPNAKHGPEWRAAFDRLHSAYVERVAAHYKQS